jgi:hypothetical protein
MSFSVPHVRDDGRRGGRGGGGLKGKRETERQRESETGRQKEGGGERERESCTDTHLSPFSPPLTHHTNLTQVVCQ